MRAVDGGMGLALEVPGEYETARVGESLRVFSPQRERTRSPPSIMISTSATQPELAGAQVRNIDNRAIHFVVSEEPGGSGGDGVRLRAWVQSNGRFVVLDSMVQPDSGGDRDFRAEWAILPTLSWQPPW
jgi:hypothetical protein